MLAPENIIAWIISLSGGAYAVWMLMLSWGWIRVRQNKTPSSQSSIRISVVIPFRNESSNIQNTILKLEAQDYPKNAWELILIDDGSSDGSYDLAIEALKKSSIAYKILKVQNTEDEGSKKAALEFGIYHAHGEVILTTDADCRVESGWVRGMARLFGDITTLMVSGPVVMTGRNTPLNIFQKVEFCGLIVSGAGGIGLGLPFMCNGANLAFRKSAFEKVGGYRGNENYRSGDDVFLMHKMKKVFGSGSIRFCKNRKALVQTATEDGIKKFLNQRLRWVSKSRGYSDGLTLGVAIIVYLFNLALLAGLIGGFWHLGLLALTIAFLMVKLIFELPMLMMGLSFVGQLRLSLAYPFASLCNVIYVTVVGFLGNIIRVSWKGRKV